MKLRAMITACFVTIAGFATPKLACADEPAWYVIDIQGTRTWKLCEASATTPKDAALAAMRWDGLVADITEVVDPEMGVIVTELRHADGRRSQFFSSKAQCDQAAQLALEARQANPVVAHCKARDPGMGESFGWCLRNEREIFNAMMALSGAERRSFFEGVNNRRAPPADNATEWARAGAKCARVADAGYADQKSVWVVRCDDERRYVVLFNDGEILSVTCTPIETLYGQSCDRVTWALGAADVPQN